jgi:hypothetical protein
MFQKRLNGLYLKMYAKQKPRVKPRQCATMPEKAQRSFVAIEWFRSISAKFDENVSRYAYAA